MYRILVIANADVSPAFALAVVERACGKGADVDVVCPALNSRLKHWFSDEDAARREAALRLDGWQGQPKALGLATGGAVCDADPVQAAADALRLAGAHEIVVARKTKASRWRERNVVERTSGLGLPVTDLTQEQPAFARARDRRRTRRVGAALAAVALFGIGAGVAAGGDSTARKLRNGKISFWSDRAFGGRAQIFVMNADGSRQRRLTSLFSAKRGDWSPDGRSLVIDGRDHDTFFDFDIFVIRANGKGLRKITSGPERDTQAVWSPDGASIAFVRDEESGGIPAVWIIGADGAGAHRVANGGPVAWSPNGKRLAVGGFGLTVMNADGSGRRTIVRGESEPAAWSADGRRILFSSWRDGNPEVYVVNADGKRLRRLTRNPREDWAADFSPDGRRILFSSDRTGLRQVYTMNLDGSGVRNLSRSRSNDWATSWQPLR